MLVDYVRVYQRNGETNIGCDPKDYPTADYIARCVPPPFASCFPYADEIIHRQTPYCIFQP